MSQEIQRQCKQCSLKITYVHKDGREDWFVFNNGFICSNCYNKNRRVKLKTILSKRVKESQRKNPSMMKKIHARRIWFYGKHIQLSHNPRIGVCSNCNRSVKKGEIDQTQMHHLFYNQFDPLSNTIELCAGCHAKETWKQRKKIVD